MDTSGAGLRAPCCLLIWLWPEGAPRPLAAASRAGRAGKQLAETRGVAREASYLFLDLETAWRPPVRHKKGGRPSRVERGRAGPSEAEHFLELPSPERGERWLTLRAGGHRLAGELPLLLKGREPSGLNFFIC